jgi:hypothetical protein
MDDTPKKRILTICTELGEDMNSDSCKALQEYVKTCPNCAAFVDSVKKTITLYKDYKPEYSDRLHRNLFKTLNFD